MLAAPINYFDTVSKLESLISKKGSTKPKGECSGDELEPMGSVCKQGKLLPREHWPFCTNNIMDFVPLGDQA